MGKKPKEVTPPPFIIHKSMDGVRGECGYCPYASRALSNEDDAEGMVRQHLEQDHHIGTRREDDGCVKIVNMKPGLIWRPGMTPPHPIPTPLHSPRPNTT